MAIENRQGENYGKHYMITCDRLQRKVYKMNYESDGHLTNTKESYRKGEYSVSMLCTTNVLHLKENK